MGHYNKEYESYYKSVIKNKRNIPNSRCNDLENIASLSRTKSLNLNILNTFIMSTIGSAVLCGAMYICKNSHDGNEIYSYMKKVCSTNFYYKEVLDKKFLSSKADSYDVTKEGVESSKESEDINIESFDNFQVIKKNKEELLKENSILPVDEILTVKTIKDIDDKHVVIDTKDNKIKAMLDGKIIDIKKDEKIGEFIVINHGEGVETYYGNLNDINRKVGEEVKQGQELGEIKENSKEGIKGVVLQIKINGEFKEPKDYIESIK